MKGAPRGPPRPWQRNLAAAGVGCAVFLVVLLLGPFGGAVRAGIALLLAAPSAAMVAFLPQIQANGRRARMDDSLPFFITHFGVLATTSLPTLDILRTLGGNKEYPEIAAETHRILRLATEWGLGLSDAVRAVAESTPSKLFGGFLLRMAHALESGQPLEAFLRSEQSVVLQEYASHYQASLLKVDSWKEMYTNALMTIGFLAVFASILPILSGGSTLVLTLAVALVTLVLEVLLGILLRERLPSDRLRPRRPVQNPSERRLRRAFRLAGAVGVAAGAAGFLLGGLGPALLAASLPFAVPGVLGLREESAIRRREGDYPAFIRSVGAAAAARGGSVRDVLGHVQTNKLGELAGPVQDLHRRLAWRVEDEASWRRFGAETGSRLIDSFTDMFVQGVRSGGKAGPISQIISDNMLRILALRTTRRATAGAFRGMLYGLAAGLAVVLFIGSGIFSHLMGTFGEHADVLEEQGLLAMQPEGSAELARQALFALVALHGVAAGLFLKLVEGGRLEGSAFYGMLQVWIGVGVGMAVLAGMPRLLG